MRTRKAVNFIEKYNRVSAKARRNYETSIEPRLAYSPPRRLQLVSRLFKNRTNFSFSQICRAHFLKSRVCKSCENPRQRSLSAPTRISEYGGIPGCTGASHPGGPQKIMFSVVSSPSPEKRRVSWPVRCVWPTKPSNACGRSLSARGACASSICLP